MKLYSTNNKKNIVNLKQATLRSLPEDKGLYLPFSIPKMEPDFINNMEQYSFPEIAFRISTNLIGDEVPSKMLEKICYKAINFPAPMKELGEGLYTLELFHGPSLAFKDFGARFMAELMSYFILEENKKLTILVATSGDTGGAVAAGFHNIPNIEVIILYPSGKVSPLQEKQLTTWGDNIHAVEYKGTFDDCQAIVKRSFLDKELNNYNLSSANSINIARLIPQTFYYFEALKHLEKDKKVTISVPSGNLGNISAASLARKMGLPIDQLIAAHNSNKTITDFFQSGEYIPRPSVSTISNAMDVGNPSNFPRFELLNGSTWNNIKNNNLAYSYSNKQTADSLKEIYNNYKYISEPHAAVAYKALQESEIRKANNHIFLGTAHPAKFIDLVEDILDIKLELPKELSVIQYQEKISQEISTYDEFIEWMKKR